MNISDAIESLRRFPQDAELVYNGRDIMVLLSGYAVEGDGGISHCPMYKLDACNLPWISDPYWLDNHKIK